MMSQILLLIFIFGISLYTSHCRSIAELRYNVNARKYLFKYGYKDEYNENMPEDQLVDSIKQLQTYANLPVTGRLDSATLYQMTIPRCGHRDPLIKITRNRRYIHQGSTWKNLFDRTGKNELKWTLLNTGRTLSYSTVLSVMRQAFSFWQEKVNINFIEVPKEKVGTSKEYEEGNIEILVSFAKDFHDDPYAFDGEGGTLAHAFYPHNNRGLSGDVHFDDAEPFTYMSPKGRNLLWIATHELGHSLGLEHSNVKEAVMYPWYTKYKPGFKLHEDDILGIQSLYGARTKPEEPKTLRPRSTSTMGTIITTTTKKPSIYQKTCPSPEGILTAIFYHQAYRQLIAFTNTDKIYFLSYPRSVPEAEVSTYVSKKRISTQIDAVYSTKIGGKDKEIIFTGPNYFVYEGFTYQSGPYSIHNGEGPLKLMFSKSVQKIDAAITWPRNGRTYFFSGTEYWRYANKKQRFDKNYPKPILGNWKGLPASIDAAFSNKEKTFFIAGNIYFEFNDNEIKVEKVYNVRKFLQCKGADDFDNKSIVDGD